MGHPARNRKRSKPDVSCQLSGPDPVPQQGSVTPQSQGPLAGLNLTEGEWDMLFCLAMKDYFEREQKDDD